MSPAPSPASKRCLTYSSQFVAGLACYHLVYLVVLCPQTNAVRELGFAYAGNLHAASYGLALVASSEAISGPHCSRNAAIIAAFLLPQ